MRIRCNYISAALMRAVDITVVIPSPDYGSMFGTLPPKFTPQHKYPVLYLLHGRGNNDCTWFDYAQATLFAEENNIAVVSFAGENKFFADCADEKWQQFITVELQEFICGNFPVSERKEDTFICGLSMGGYGAMLNYLKAPERYGAVGCFSGAFDKYALAQEKDEFNVHKLIEKQKKAGVSFAPIYLACGENDFILDNSKHLKRTLEQNGVDFCWVLEKGFGHEWRFWNAQLEKFIKWLPRSDFYAGKAKRL